MQHLYILDYVSGSIRHKAFPSDLDMDYIENWINTYFNEDNIEWMISNEKLEIEDYDN